MPSIADNPDKLHIFIDKGSVAAKPTGNLCFEYRYRLNLIVTDFADDADKLMVPVLVWISRQQPLLLDQMHRGKEPFAFEVDVLEHGKVDVSIELEVSEVAVVSATPDGGYTVEHPPEPQFDEPFDGVPSNVRLWQVFFRDDLLGEYALPDGANPIP